MVEYSQVLHEIQKTFSNLNKERKLPQEENIEEFISLVHNYLSKDKRKMIVVSFYWNDERLKETFGDKTIIINKELDNTQDIKIDDIEERFKRESEKFKKKYDNFVSLVNIYQKTSYPFMWIKPQAESSGDSFFDCIKRFFELLESSDELRLKVKSNIEGFKDDLIDILFKVYNVENKNEEDLNIFYYPSFIGDTIFFDGLFFFEIPKDQNKWEKLISLERIISIFIRDLHLSIRLYFSRLESIRTAIAAIMSRNMSHNIGSHVLADLVANGKTVSKAELNHLYRYLQNRMDFIAQITTEFPQWTYPAYFTKELMRIFYENSILLDRIGVSEGLSAYDWPEDWRKGNMREKIIVRSYLAQWGKENRNPKLEPDKADWIINEYHMEELSDDLQLAIPGGIVGYHAFYVIIENIIRNSAKHGYATRMSETLKPNKNGAHSNDGVIYIRYDGDKKCRYWIIDENKACKKNTIDVNKIQEKINDCRALVIDSTCFKERPVLPNLPIKLVDDCEFTIDEVNRLYVTCVGKSDECKFYIKENNGKKCLVVDKNLWEEDKFPFKVLTSKEKSKLDEIMEEEKHDEIIDFLQKGPLRINIRVDDMIDKDYVWVTIWDNIRHFPTINFDRRKGEDIKKEVCGNLEDLQEYSKKKRVVKEPEECKKDETSVNLFGFMNDRLRQSFIKETGELKKEDWGIAELKICAGFLQNREIDEIGVSGKGIIEYGQYRFDLQPDYLLDKKDNPNYGYPKMLIKALPVEKNGMGKTTLEKEKDDFYFLGYRFWMKKPKIVAITGEHEDNLESCSSQGEK